MLVVAKDLSENYNNILEGLAADAFKGVIAYFDNVVDENGNKHNINFEDICNTVTNAAQMARREYAAKVQV